jgi:hypothetical protein
MARLTERGVQTAKPGRHSDGDGLHLVVSEAGRKKWVLRYQVAWAPFVVAVNRVNRAMGRPDLYPFVLAPAVVDKLAFIS